MYLRLRHSAGRCDDGPAGGGDDTGDHHADAVRGGSAYRGFRPARGWPGTIVTIEGINFTGMTSVRFGDRPAQFTVTAATQIRAVVRRVKEGPITVSHEESATSDEAFTLAGPGPVIDKLDEWVGAPGDWWDSRVNFTGVTSVWLARPRGVHRGGRYPAQGHRAGGAQRAGHFDFRAWPRGGGGRNHPRPGDH